MRPALTMLSIGGLLSTTGPVRPPAIQSLQEHMPNLGLVSVDLTGFARSQKEAACGEEGREFFVSMYSFQRCPKHTHSHEP